MLNLIFIINITYRNNNIINVYKYNSNFSLSILMNKEESLFHLLKLLLKSAELSFAYQARGDCLRS